MDMMLGGQLGSERLCFFLHFNDSHINVKDAQDNPGYFAGDIFDGANFDVFTDAAISTVIGETQYTSTGFVDNNLITNQANDPYYCAGCVSIIAGKRFSCYDVTFFKYV